MRESLKKENGIVLFEALMAIVVLLHVGCLGWDVANKFQLYHQVENIFDAEFKYGNRPYVQGAFLKDSANIKTLDLQKIFRERLSKIRKEICAKILDNTACDRGLALRISYKGHQYSEKTTSTVVKSKIKIPVIVANEFSIRGDLLSNRSPLLSSIKLFNPIISIERSYPIHEGASWVH